MEMGKGLGEEIPKRGIACESRKGGSQRTRPYESIMNALSFLWPSFLGETFARVWGFPPERTPDVFRPTEESLSSPLVCGVN
jgi:hypothetical protein